MGEASCALTNDLKSGWRYMLLGGANFDYTRLSSAYPDFAPVALCNGRPNGDNPAFVLNGASFVAASTVSRIVANGPGPTP